MLHTSVPPCWPSCPPHCGICKITKFTAVGALSALCSLLQAITRVCHCFPTASPLSQLLIAETAAHSCCPLTCAGFSCSLRFCQQQEPALSTPNTAQRMQDSPASFFVFGGGAQLFVLETIGTTPLIHTCSSFCYSSVPVLPFGNVGARSLISCSVQTHFALYWLSEHRARRESPRAPVGSAVANTRGPGRACDLFNMYSYNNFILESAS